MSMRLTQFLASVSSLIAAFIIIGCGQDKTELTPETVTPKTATSSKGSSSKVASSKSQTSKGLKCELKLGNSKRITYVGALSRNGKTVMATRASTFAEDGKTVNTLLHDDGKSIASYTWREREKKVGNPTPRPGGVFDGNIDTFLKTSTMTGLNGDCEVWVVEPERLIPPSSSPQIDAPSTRDIQEVENIANPDFDGKAYLANIMQSDSIICGKFGTPGKGMERYESHWKDYKLRGIKPGLFQVKYKGLSTPDINDDVFHHTHRFYVVNSAADVKGGNDPIYVPVTRHVLINHTGRYQWVQNAQSTFEKVKAIDSLEKGSTLESLKQHFIATHISANVVQGGMKDRERKAFHYSLNVWADNIRSKGYPPTVSRECKTLSENIIKPPSIEYTSIQDIYDKKISEGVSDKRARAESKKEFAAAFKLRNFPIPLELKGQPKFDPATYSTNSK